MMRTIACDRSMSLLPGAAAPPAQSASYAWMSFEVGEALSGLELELEFTSARTVQLPFFAYDGEGRLRAARASEPGKGAQRLRFPLGEGRPGEWKLVFQKRILAETLALRARVSGSPAVPATAPAPFNEKVPRFAFAGAVPDPRPGWYCGELHLHSDHSTGRTDIATIRRVALEKGLDFLSLTDHITASHWDGIEALGAAGARPLFLQSLEIAGDRGHANLHGVSTWPNPFPDDSDGALSAFLGSRGGGAGGAVAGSMEQAADIAHAQGALLCINHPLSAGVPWRYGEFPLEKADLIEVASLPDGSVSFLYPTLWDRLLCAGTRVTGVGSSDSHDPLQVGPWGLGQIRTWVLADSLSREGILEGLRAGRAYVALGGAKLDFHAKIEGAAAHGESARFEMGSTLALGAGETCVVRVEMSGIPAGNLFLMKDGLLQGVRRIPAAAAVEEYRFAASDIAPNGESFVRIEFHEEIEPPRYHGMASRDHRSLRLLSNPIWLRSAAKEVLR